LNYVFFYRHVTTPLFAISGVLAFLYFKAIAFDGLTVPENLPDELANA
jgi:hypothetical protein